MAKRSQATSDWSRSLAFPGIVASCRIRLARNLRGECFPDHASPQDRERIRDLVCSRLQEVKSLKDCTTIPVETASQQALQELREAHLISTEFTERGSGGALLLNPDRSLSLMINEEDHLRIQVLRRDADLRAAWRVADKMDRDIEQQLDVAFHPSYGYLTACPSNVGTGLRVSVMLHLLGLRLTDEIDAVFKALDRLGIAVRGIWGEGSEAAGHLYQLSNQQTLGETEEEIIDRLGDVAEETARQEQNARMRLIEDKPELMMDCLARALAILRNARILHSDEALDFLCALRMGADAGLVLGIEPEIFDYWSTAILPGHMQTLAKGVLEPEARDRIRAELMRRAMESVSLAG